MNIQLEMAAYIKSEYAISQEVTLSMFDNEVLTEHQSRKVLIRNEYLQLSKKLRLTEIKEKLADKYCLSVSSIEKYLAGV